MRTLPLLLGPALLFGSLITLPTSAQAQTRRPARTAAAAPQNLYSTYNYLDYIVYNKASERDQLQDRTVGGTLTLRADGTFAKRLTLNTPAGLTEINQDGQFAVSGDSIRFRYPGPDGRPRTDRGTYRHNSKTGELALTIIDIPRGNRGLYKLMAQEVIEMR